MAVHAIVYKVNFNGGGGNPNNDPHVCNMGFYWDGQLQPWTSATAVDSPNFVVGGKPVVIHTSNPVTTAASWTSGSCVTHNNLHTAPCWFTFDFGANPPPITNMQFTGLTDHWCFDSYSIQTSDDGTNWADLIPTTTSGIGCPRDGTVTLADVSAATPATPSPTPTPTSSPTPSPTTTGPFFCNGLWTAPDFYSVALTGYCDKDGPKTGTVTVLESLIGNGAMFACNHWGDNAHLAVPWGKCNGGDGLSAAVGHGANFQCVNGNGNIPGYRGRNWGNVGLHDCSTTIAYLNALWPQPTPAVPDGYTMHAGMGSGEGNIISNMEDTTVLQCADACDQLPSCVAFTMKGDLTECTLKSAVTLSSVSGKDTYVKQASTPASATGDPHLQNVHGERFDLMKEGKHVLISIPRGESAELTLFRVQADARRLGGRCTDMYFQELNVTGSWAEAKHTGGYHYDASQSAVKTPQWVAFGKVELKVAHGRTDSGLRYLNVYAKHLGQAGFVVGGLLGEDDHEDVSTPGAECMSHMSLQKIRKHMYSNVSAAASVAEGTFA
jgi:hypothetical protein